VLGLEHEISLVLAGDWKPVCVRGISWRTGGRERDVVHRPVVILEDPCAPSHLDGHDLGIFGQTCALAWGVHSSRSESHVASVRVPILGSWQTSLGWSLEMLSGPFYRTRDSVMGTCLNGGHYRS